jgi:LEA14-like dessication related protein
VVTVSYEAALNDVVLARNTRSGVGFGPGRNRLTLTAQMRNDRIPAWWVTHIRNDENTTLAVNATVRSGLVGQSATVVPTRRNVSTDIIGQFNSTETREVNADAPLVSDPVAYVNRTNATWGAVSENRTPIDAEIAVYNPKPYPLAVNELGYNITMNGIPMGEGHTERSYTIPPETERTLDARLVMRNDNIDEWWVSHLERNQRTNLEVGFYLRVDAAGSVFRVPLRGLTNERVIETDFFGNKNTTASTNASADDGATDGTTTDSGTTTDDGTTSETTATDGGTTTDDGVIGDGTTEDDGLLARAP